MWPATAGGWGRQLARAANNVKITLACGLVTFLVLRGTLGAGRFGTPSADAQRLVGAASLRPHRRALKWHVLGSDKPQVAEEEFPYDPRRPYSLGPKISGEALVLASVWLCAPPALSARCLWQRRAVTSCGEECADWNERREMAIAHKPGCNVSASGRPRMMLVTGSQPKECENPLGDHLLLMAFKMSSMFVSCLQWRACDEAGCLTSLALDGGLHRTQNKMDYCRLHDVEVFYNMAHLDRVMSGFWAKLPLLRHLMLSHPEIEWFWWMDSDAMFTDMVFELPMEKYEPYDMVLHGWERDVYELERWVGLNTGSFLIRNNQWILDMLDVWAQMGPKGRVRTEAGKLLTAALKDRPAFEADDQSALVYLLIKNQAEWRPHVYLEQTYFLHGYWGIIVDKYEELMAKHHPGYGDERWPFVTHFVGCKPCSLADNYDAERCVVQMNRAFNFADNQVLQHYGYGHKHLNTTAIEAVNTTALAASRHSEPEDPA
eukprot:SM000295S11270  [mRNA]  locus=s295:40433:43336:+ [translate_table: standard]